MFESVIDSTNIIKAELTHYKIGNVILWLMAMYDVYHDYKICIEFESKWRIGILEYLYNMDNWEAYISKYLYNLIYEELNLEIVEYELNEVEFYNIENDNFNFDYDLVAYKVLENEIRIRRNLVVEKIRKYFSSGYDILEFVSGEHCSEHYYRLEKKIQKLEQKYEKQILLIDEEICSL